jgi:hypothetical protein
MYLSPERGWIPLSPAETTRRRFGDCKDLTTWLVAEARAAGLAAAPALARIGEGVIEDDEPPSVFAFNHVIAAIRLEQSLGLPAEVETPEGRFLLVDATSRFVPLGRLDSGHAGRRVLICLPRGGVWVRVPDEAIVDDRFVVRLEGQVEDKGGYKGGLLLRAVGDAMGLRSADVEGGVEELRKRCYRLGLPPDAHCAVKTRSDPFDLGRDYEVVFEVQYSGALRDAGGGEFTLHVPGLAVSTESLVKAGRKRLQPVLVEGRSGREYDLDLRLARKLVPLLAKDRGDTPFRAYEFAAEATGTPEAPGVRVRFAESRRAAYFDFARREEGTAAWRKDRAQMRRLLEDGLTLRAAP